jgi:CRP/FNR family transcriptional regulator, cyclic AMP receptor protein
MSDNHVALRISPAEGVDGAATCASQPPDARLATVSRLPLLAGLSAEKLAEFMARTRWQAYVAGETVVDVGDTTNDVFFIIKGAVRVVVRTAFGYESILNDLGKGDFFGEVAAIDGIPRSASVTALVHTRLCVVPGPAFMDLVLSSPKIGHRLLCLLSSRLRNKDERLIEFGALTVRQRLIAELLRLSRGRANGERVISPPSPQHILAARVGTSRESVSREMAEMSRSGLITVGRGGIVLHRPEVLKSEIEARLQGSADPGQNMKVDRL